jgi:hypothetical protein
MDELQDESAPVKVAAKGTSAMGDLTGLAGGAGAVPDIDGGGVMEADKAGGVELSSLQSLMEKAKSIFGGGSSKSSPTLGGGNRIALAKGFNRSFDSPPVSTSRGGPRGRLSRMDKKPPRGLVTGTPSVKRGSASRAMGQLKFAASLSGTGRDTSGNEQASSLITASFDQQTASKAQLETPGSGKLDGLGQGLDGTGTSSSGSSDLGAGENVSPYQDDMEKAAALDGQGRDLHDQAEELKEQGNDLKDEGKEKIDQGYLLIAAGSGCLPFAHCMAMIAYGYSLVNEGSAKRAQGNMLLEQSAQKEDQSQGKFAESHEVANGIDEEHGQNMQANQVREDADNTPVNTQPEQPKSTVQQDVQTERNADYKIKK